MQAYRLLPHPAHPPAGVSAIEVRIGTGHRNWLELRWRIEGAEALVLPEPAGKARADGLWQRSCFELFLLPQGGGAYCEFNLSPSEQWNAYGFDGYREGMRELDLPRAPVCTMRGRGSRVAIFDAAIPRASLPAGPCAMGISAVIEERGGAKSYWALAHPPGKPDFHHADCFALTLEAPAAS